MWGYSFDCIFFLFLFRKFFIFLLDFFMLFLMFLFFMLLLLESLSFEEFFMDCRYYVCLLVVMIFSVWKGMDLLVGVLDFEIEVCLLFVVVVLVDENVLKLGLWIVFLKSIKFCGYWFKLCVILFEENCIFLVFFVKLWLRFMILVVLVDYEFFLFFIVIFMIDCFYWDDW